MSGKIERGLKIPVLDNIQLYPVLKLGGRYIGMSGTTEGYGLLH